MSYVLVYCEVEGRVLLIRKDRPKWMSGRLNLPGGKIEPGESPHAAAERELVEEAGLTSDEFDILGVIEIEGGHVYCVRTRNIDAWGKRGAEETEVLEWRDIKEVMTDSTLMPNLKVIIPLLSYGVRDWKMRMAGDDSEVRNVMELEIV